MDRYDENDVSYYIRKISEMSNESGDKLIEMMDMHGVNGLMYITLQQAREFYHNLINAPVV